MNECCDPDHPIPTIPWRGLIKTSLVLLRGVITGDNLVLSSVAEHRARICTICLINRVTGRMPWYYRYVLKVIKYGCFRHTESDKFLGVCGLCACVNAAQVHFKHRKPSKITYPGHCWKNHPED